MENKRHTIKFWGGKDKVQTVEYISVSAVQEWIDQMKTVRPQLSIQIAENELLEELETFLYDKK